MADLGKVDYIGQGVDRAKRTISGPRPSSPQGSGGFDPTGGDRNSATALQMAHANPTVENLVAVGAINPLGKENQTKIAAWLKDDPDGGKDRAVWRLKNEISYKVGRRCRQELACPEFVEGASFDNVDLVWIECKCSRNDLRIIIKYMDEFEQLYYEGLVSLMITWMPIKGDQDAKAE